jgi:protein-tyrosine phosphatase
MWTKLYWLEGDWPGKLALAARPRGGDWLDDELASWRRSGVDVVLSLLTPEEESDLGLEMEGRESKALGMEFMSFAIPDREVPSSEADLTLALEHLDRALSSGRNVVIHCRQGIGRSGLVAACLLVFKGSTPDSAIRKLSTVRGVPIPETLDQRRWIDHYTGSTTATMLNPSAQ